MTDPRIQRLADVLVGYSTAVRPGERILIEALDVQDEFAIACIRAAHERGAHPLVQLKHNRVTRALMHYGGRPSWELAADVELLQMKGVQCYIGARGNLNVAELSDVPLEQNRIFESTLWKRVHIEQRVRHTRWCVLRWPNPSMAQLAQMSTEAFEDFFFQVCTADYARMERAMLPLQARLARTDAVRLLGPGTDLRFSIRGLPAILCSGRHNIPDGEVFTAPVRDSLHGVIQYNAPTLYRGTTHENVRFVFRAGRIVEASSSNTPRLLEVLDSDPGARYVGEFAIGVNPYVTYAMKDALFDEKIAGSIHLTPGGSYDEADNGNRSEIHWDIVLIQTPEFGGGELHFDGELIRKDGRFIPADLQPLNPENLRN